MTYRTIRGALADILSQEEEALGPETRLWGAVGAVDVARLVLFCEERFRVTIRDGEVSGFSRLIDLVRYVEALRRDGKDDYQMPTESGREAWYYE